MIKIQKNQNCQGWIQVFSFGQFVDEVQGRARARRIATKLARQHEQTHISQFGKVVRLD